MGVHSNDYYSITLTNLSVSTFNLQSLFITVLNKNYKTKNSFSFHSVLLFCENQFSIQKKEEKGKMLAVFNKSVAKSPEGLQSPESNSVSSLKDGFLAQLFASLNPSSVTLNLASSGLLAYSVHKDNPLLPRFKFLIF
jgi:hypothetical protein